MQEIKEFREVIRALINASSSPCLEREIRQAYWEETGFNVDAFLQKFAGSSSLLAFLETECRDFCAVVRDGQLGKIYRKSCPKTKHLDHFTRAGERKFQQQFQPKNNQPRAYQQNFYNNGQSENKALSEQQLQDVYALRCVLGAIFYNQSCFTANMNLLNDPSLTFPAMNLALQGLQNSAANILNMTVNYTNLMTQAFLRSQLMSNHSQNVAQDKPGRFIYGAQQQELVDVETVKDLKQEKQDNCQNEAIEVSKEAAEVAQVKTRGLQKENFAEKAEMRPPLLKKGFVVDIHVLSVEPSLRFKFTYDDYGLAKLMKELQTLYSSIDSESKLAYDHIQPGSTVAAKIFDVWHRAKVISGLDKEGKIELEFIDFGTRQKLPTKDVRHLCSKFKQDPIRFYHGQCVLPAFVSSTPEAAQKFFAEKSLNTKLYAKVVGFSGDLCQMKVYDANGVDFFSDLIKLKV